MTHEKQMNMREVDISKFSDFTGALTGNSATGMGRLGWIGFTGLNIDFDGDPTLATAALK